MKLVVKVLIVVLLSGALRADAQFETVYIGINGLTCSQCSKTVETQVRKLDFVRDVQMNLQRTEATILLRENKKVAIDKIARAVKDAGFSLRSLKADIHIGNTVSVSGNCMTSNGDTYVLTQPLKRSASGTVSLRFLGKEYQPKGDYKKNTSPPTGACGNAAGTTYFVTETDN